MKPGLHIASIRIRVASLPFAPKFLTVPPLIPKACAVAVNTVLTACPTILSIPRERSQCSVMYRCAF